MDGLSHIARELFASADGLTEQPMLGGQFVDWLCGAGAALIVRQRRHPAHDVCQHPVHARAGHQCFLPDGVWIAAAERHMLWSHGWQLRCGLRLSRSCRNGSPTVTRWGVTGAGCAIGACSRRSCSGWSSAALRAHLPGWARAARPRCEPATTKWNRDGVFDRAVEEALAGYDRIIGLDPSDVSVDASLHKAPPDLGRDQKTASFGTKFSKQ